MKFSTMSLPAVAFTVWSLDDSTKGAIEDFFMSEGIDATRRVLLDCKSPTSHWTGSASEFYDLSPVDLQQRVFAQHLSPSRVRQIRDKFSESIRRLRESVKLRKRKEEERSFDEVEKAIDSLTMLDDLIPKDT